MYEVRHVMFNTTPLSGYDDFSNLALADLCAVVISLNKSDSLQPAQTSCRWHKTDIPSSNYSQWVICVFLWHFLHLHFAINGIDGPCQQVYIELHLATKLSVLHIVCKVCDCTLFRYHILNTHCMGYLCMSQKSWAAILTIPRGNG